MDIQKLKAITESIDELVAVTEKTEIYKSLGNEIPDGILDYIPESLRLRYKSMYIDMRINGNTKEKSLQTSNSIISRAIQDNKITLGDILKDIEKSLESIKERVIESRFTDSENMENTGPKNITPTEGSDDFNKQEEVQ